MVIDAIIPYFAPQKCDELDLLTSPCRQLAF